MEDDMQPTRRDFLRASAGAVLAGGAAVDDASAGVLKAREAPQERRGPANYEAWIEVDEGALRHNAHEVARLAGGRPVLAVVKNNAYGLGVARTGAVLDAVAEVAGLAVVKPAEALALRAAGVRKPILFMGLADVPTGIELARQDIQLAPFTDDAGERCAAIARAVGRPVRVHLYIDSGMSRMGLPHARALPWIEALARAPHVRIDGIFTELAESDEYDAAQIEQFSALTRQVRDRGIDPGMLHAASSHALFFRPDIRLDMVRPGLALYGAYPAGARATGLAELRPAFRLRAKVARVARIDAGTGVSYGRNYVAERPTWIATLPVGHADGYTRQAVRGAEVLVGNRLYRVIGAVSASHTILEIGDELTVNVGDTATLVGPDHPAIHPNTLAERAGISVYDVLMHLNADLPKVDMTA
jgi:alanine racemase